MFYTIYTSKFSILNILNTDYLIIKKLTNSQKFSKNKIYIY